MSVDVFPRATKDGTEVLVPYWDMPHPHEAETPEDRAAWAIVYDLFPDKNITTSVGTMTWALHKAWLVRYHMRKACSPSK